MIDPAPITIRVFYSWQTDLPEETNRRRIRTALLAAASRVEEEHAGSFVQLQIDEATRGLPGSPNIPASILSKIRQADIFVADITTINADLPPERRRTPNPNVAFELGYAVAVVGWDRIILLLNTQFGTPKDAPFDIDRQRISTYLAGEEAKGKDAKNQLEQLVALLTDAISAIVAAKPRKASAADMLTPEEIKRRHDALALREVLEMVHLPTLDQQLEDGPRSMPYSVIHFVDSLTSIIKSSLFHINDSELRRRILDFSSAWETSVAHGEFYDVNRNATTLIFTRHSSGLSKIQMDEWSKIQRELDALRGAKDGLLEFVRQHYWDIDVGECSELAWRRYKEFEERTARSLEGNAKT